MTSYQIGMGASYILCSKSEYLKFLGLAGDKEREEYFNMLAQSRPSYCEIDE
ncbi:hypothetical protein [Vibrio cholerae]|uniref:hypothetical protein n=1 Tax=Vibrio cholerae TaxID=666 RepID=UPI001482E9D9|nr:hypothetical protein [Vibrio cholerae]